MSATLSPSNIAAPDAVLAKVYGEGLDGKFGMQALSACIMARAGIVLVEDYDLSDGDTAGMFERAAVAAAGQKILLKRNGVYTFNRVSVLNTPDLDIEGNGAVLLAPLGAISHVPRTSYTLGNYFTITKGARTFTIPAGLGSAIVRGAWVRFESNTVRVATGNYLWGECLEIANVSGGVATTVQPFLGTYQVDTIRVERGNSSRVVNLTVDMSGVDSIINQDVTGTPFIGIALEAKKIRADVIAYGNQWGGAGVTAIGMDVIVGGFADGFTNDQGIGVGGVSGRIGYGFAASGRIVSLFGRAYNCKHCFTASSRNFVTERIAHERLFTSTPDGSHNDTVTINGQQQARYQGQIDVHANVLEAISNGCTTDGPNVHYMMRNDRWIINDPVMFGRGVSTNFGQNGLIYCSETATEELVVNNPKVATETVRTGLPTPNFIHLYGVFPDMNFGRIKVNDGHFENVRLLGITTSAAIDMNMSVSLVQFNGGGGRIIGGVCINGFGNTVRNGPIKNLIVNGNYTLASPNYSLEPMLWVTYTSHLGKVTGGGNWDCRALYNTHNPIQIGRTADSGQAGQPMNGYIGDFDFTKLNLKAARTAIDITTTKAAAATTVTTNATGYALGSTVITVTGTGTIADGDTIAFGTVPTPYRVKTGIADASIGGTITLDGPLTSPIPAAATAINTPAPGHLNFNGAVIEYNWAQATSGASGIKIETASMPYSLTTFKGATVRNRGGGIGSGNTPAIQFPNNIRNDDISGVTVNDYITQTSATSPTARGTYAPTGVTLEGLTTIPWRNSLVMIDNQSRLCALIQPTAVTLGGLTVYQLTPSLGAPTGWACSTPGNWTCLGFLGIPNATTAQLSSLTDPINIIGTTNKVAGKTVFNTNTSKLVTANGPTAGATWVDATGTVVHTPV